MDNVTHTLAGLALAKAGFNRKTRYATLALVLGSNLPDLDVVASAGGGAAYLKYHRGITHSLLGVVVIAVALFGLLYWLGRRKQSEVTPGGPPGAIRSGPPPLNARWLFYTCLAATGLHLLMDFTNSYGTRPFLPFSGRWYAWDIMYILDPLLLAILLAGLALPALFRLISEEVGARKPGYSKGAMVALCGMVLLWGLRDFSRRRVLGMLDGHTYGQENPRALGAFPSPGNPFAWNGVVETPSAFYVLEASSLDADVNPEFARAFRKPASSPALEAALRTRTGAIFTDFARFPWAQVEQSDDGARVVMRDLRFFSFREERPSFVAEFELDGNLRVLSEWFGFRGRPPSGEHSP